MEIKRHEPRGVTPLLLLLLIGGIWLAAGAAPPAATRLNPQAKQSAALFDYDRSRALDVKTESVTKQKGVAVRDISFAGTDPTRRRVRAYLVAPERPRNCAGLLFFHWLGKPKGDRTEFLDEAVALAGRGAVSLLIQGTFPWVDAPTDGETDRRRIINQTIDVRRALDVLLAQPGVDPNRIGYVGHDYGAMYGALVAGADSRAKTYVFMAGMGSFSDWSLKYWPATAAARGEQAYRDAVSEVDPVKHLAAATPTAALFQFAESDIYIPKQTALDLYEGAGGAKEIRWYPAEHDLNVPAARDDRRRWLARQLKLPEESADGRQ